MKIVFYGLSITSSWGNGHATTYRSLLKALAKRGHRIEFVEKDVEWYRSNRDMLDPGFCTVKLYESWEQNSMSILATSADADVIVIGSYFPDAIKVAEALFSSGRCPILFYDIDTPITLAALRSSGATDYLCAELIQNFSAYLSFTGGPALEELEHGYGARRAFPFYCSVDPDLYYAKKPCPRFSCDLSYLGTYAPDRQRKLVALLDDAATLLPQQRFLVAGPLYPSESISQTNVNRLVHVPPSQHPSFYSSSRFTLNLTRSDMVIAGYSPSVRLFEASACGAAILSDDWAGLPEFLTPGEEILLPADAYEVASILVNMTDDERQRIGQRARDRVLAGHTSTHRALQFEQIVSHCGA